MTTNMEMSPMRIDEREAARQTIACLEAQLPAVGAMVLRPGQYEKITDLASGWAMSDVRTVEGAARYACALELLDLMTSHLTRLKS